MHFYLYTLGEYNLVFSIFACLTQSQALVTLCKSSSESLEPRDFGIPYYLGLVLAARDGDHCPYQKSHWESSESLCMHQAHYRHQSGLNHRLDFQVNLDIRFVSWMWDVDFETDP